MPEPPSLRLRLAHARCLTRSRDFATLKAEGRRLSYGCLLANWRVLPAGSRSRIGVVASRKLGSAVARNRARRLLREVYRLHQHELAEPVDLVLVARPSIVGKKFADVDRDFVQALHRARLLTKTT